MTACALGLADLMWGDNTYSRVVAWLKIILPLAALAILSTLFLLSRSIDPTNTIPFAEVDVEERARDQQLTAPFFAGASEQGDLISFAALSARPDPEEADRAIAKSISARIKLVNGSVITFSADRGIIDTPNDEARLEGGVVVTSTTGYTIRTETLISGMRKIAAETLGPVTASGPPGRFSAGKMLLTNDAETGNSHLVFTNGVKLVYTPNNTKDK